MLDLQLNICTMFDYAYKLEKCWLHSLFNASFIKCATTILLVLKQVDCFTIFDCLCQGLRPHPSRKPAVHLSILDELAAGGYERALAIQVQAAQASAFTVWSD